MASMAELPDTLSKLSDVRKQQTAALQSLERLTQQQLGFLMIFTFGIFWAQPVQLCF